MPTERPETPSKAAMRIARATLDGGYDPLLACRDLSALRAPLEAQVQAEDYRHRVRAVVETDLRRLMALLDH